MIQIPYNIFDRRLDKCGFFERAAEKGVQIYARSSLLQGLAVMAPSNLPQNVSFANSYLIEFDNICKNFGITKLNAAIGYVYKKKGISYIVFGVDNKNQLLEYTTLGNIEISDEMIKMIDETFMNVPEKLVNPTLWK